SCVAAPRAVDEHDRVDAAEKVIGLEFQMEADADIAVASALAAFEADGHIIVGALFVIDDRAGQVVVAHDVGEGVEQSSVSRSEEDANVVTPAEDGLSIGDSVERAGIGAGGRISGNGAQAIHGTNIELNNRAGGVPGD